MTNANTTTINDTITSLNGLVNGYSQILAMAKEQLEHLDLSENDKDRLARKTTEDPYFRRRTASQLLELITEPQYQSEDDQRHIEAFLDVVSRRVAERLTDQFIEDRFASVLGRKLDEMRVEALERTQDTIKNHIEYYMSKKADEWKEDFSMRNQRDEIFERIVNAAYGPQRGSVLGRITGLRDVEIDALIELAQQRVSEASANNSDD